MPRMRKRLGLILLLAVPLLCLCAAATYNLPPVHERLAWRLESLLTEIRYIFNPPEQVVFVPQSTIDPTAVEAIVQATLHALATPTSLPPPAPPPGPSSHTHPSQGQPDRHPARVPAAEQLRPDHPGYGAFFLGLERRPNRYARLFAPQLCQIRRQERHAG
jgi:hypothetical protein